MKIAIFSTKKYDKKFLLKANEKYNFNLKFFEVRLTEETIILAKGYKIISVFVNDVLNRKIIKELFENGTKLIALRSAGYNNVDLEAAAEYGIKIVRVPAYSPEAVAEHTIALMLSLNRKIYKAYNRVREGNFSLEGLMGFDMRGKTVGVVGTGKIGRTVINIVKGFGTKIIAYDKFKNDEMVKLGVEYVSVDDIFRKADIISLHCPLLSDTYHIVNKRTINLMKDGSMIINTSRGELIDTFAAVEGLKNGKIGYLGLDVYEEEDELFFEDMSDKVIIDDLFSRLLTFPNVVITGHQGFFTDNALTKISEVTLNNINDFLNKKELINEIK